MSVPTTRISAEYCAVAQIFAPLQMNERIDQIMQDAVGNPALVTEIPATEAVSIHMWVMKGFQYRMPDIEPKTVALIDPKLGLTVTPLGTRLCKALSGDPRKGNFTDSTKKGKK